MRVIIDSFSSLDDLPKKKRSDPDSLLAFLKETGTTRISTFEMDHKIARALSVLVERGQIRRVETPYPWLGFRLVSNDEQGG